MNSRISKEKATVALMITLYCRRYEKNKALCPECTELLRYAEARLDRCLLRAIVSMTATSRDAK